MRLAIVVTEFPKVTETFVYRDVVEFARRGHEVRLYHLTRFREGEVLHDFARKTIDLSRYVPYASPGVLARFLATFVTRPLVIAGVVAALIRGYARHPVWLLKSFVLLPKCTVIARELADWGADHLHGEFATHPGTCGWIVRRLAGVPYSVSCHAHDIFRTQAMLDKKLGEAAFVRVISEYNERFLKERVPALREQRFLVNHVGVDTESLAPLDAPATEPFRLLYVGSLEQRKGVHVLLRALAAAGPKLGEWSCDLLGGGPMREELEALAKELGLDGSMRFHGPRPYEEVAAATERASVLVVPSTYDSTGRTEGIPTVLIEALAHRRPVIATRVSGIPELVVDGETGVLVEHADVDALAAALERVHADPDAAFAMACRGREKVEAEFDLEGTVGGQLAAFESARR